jgi:hypothetical protein
MEERNMGYPYHIDFANPKSKYSDSKKIKTPKRIRYCCERFALAVKEKEIMHSYSSPRATIDETTWFINTLWHLYYCPFCGAFIKGKGFGNYDEKYPPLKRK